MDRAELRDRLRQAWGSRQDSLLARMGYDFGRNARRAAGGVGNFFFTADSVDTVLQLIRERLPGHAESIVRQADEICGHRFDLLGYIGLDYGSPLNWHLDAVHNKRAPRKAFYKIRYLDFAEVGDSKITWELNRHQHLVTLAKAYRLTKERRYADEALRQWRHWQAENPYPIGINWASSLEVAFRSLSWLWMYYLLQRSAGIPDLRSEWLRALALNGRHIERHLSTYFSPNTHLLGEGVALFFLGVLCPELAAAERWKAMGWKIVLEAAERQVRGDGFHFEQSTYYHVYALDLLLHSAVLASVNGIALPKSFENTIEKMLAALCLLSRGGGPPRFGDDDGGRLFDPQRNRGEHLLDPLSTGAILFHRGDYKSAAVGLREESLWLLGEEGVRQWDALEVSAPPNESAALKDAGVYMLTSDGPTQVVVDAGPLGAQTGGHGHSDALSVCLHSCGRSLLIDPGTYEYVGPGSERNLYRGTAMHNTLRVDGLDQAEPAGPFSWRRLTKSRVEQWIQGKQFDLLVAGHDGYHRFDNPVTHRRTVVSLRNGAYLVRDAVEGIGKHRLELNWHLGPDLQRGEDGMFRIPGGIHGLAILPTLAHGWAEDLRAGEWSPAYGQKGQGSILTYSCEVTLPAEFAVLLITMKEAGVNIASFVRVRDDESNVCGYRYSDRTGETMFAFGRRGQPWRKDSVSSDAEFVCWQKTSEVDSYLILCGGSYAEISGGTTLRCVRPVDWAELMVKPSGRAVFSSDMAAVEEPTAGAPEPDAASSISERD